MIVFRIKQGFGLTLGLCFGLFSAVDAQEIPSQSFPPPVIIQSAPPHAILEVAKPVEVTGLSDINPESVGLLAASDGGLGAALWKGTSRSVIEKLMPALGVPLTSPALNDLARRLLISTTAVPEGASSISQSLPSMRVTKLVMAGDPSDAWKLAMLTKPDLLSDVPLRLATEAQLVAPQNGVDICKLLPTMIQNHNNSDWQKILVVCQLRAKDIKAAQLGLDLLHAQDVKDEVFFDLAEKNIIAGSKMLPKHLAPLNAVSFSLLRLTGLDFPRDVYVHPEAALTAALLLAPTKDEDARLALAEQAGAQGIITSMDLASAYKATSPSPVATIKNQSSLDTGPRLRALLYQSALQEKTLQVRLDDAEKFLQMAPTSLLQGAGGALLLDMVGPCQASPDLHDKAPLMIEILLLSGKRDLAMDWLKEAQAEAEKSPDVMIKVHKLWPLLVFSGLESDQNYAADRDHWLDVTLRKSENAKDNKAQRQQAASLLLLLEAAGYAVTDNDWTKVMGATESVAHGETSAFILERLATAAAFNRRGETILLSLVAAKEGIDASSQTMVSIIKALRSIGLIGDASTLAREAVITILLSQPSVP